MLDVLICQFDGTCESVGQVIADTLDDAMLKARALAPSLGQRATLCLVRPGVDVSKEARERTLFAGRLWRSSESRRVAGQRAKKRKMQNGAG